MNWDFIWKQLKRHRTISYLHFCYFNTLKRAFLKLILQNFLQGALPPCTPRLSHKFARCSPISQRFDPPFSKSWIRPCSCQKLIETKIPWPGGGRKSHIWTPSSQWYWNIYAPPLALLPVNGSFQLQGQGRIRGGPGGTAPPGRLEMKGKKRTILLHCKQKTWYLNTTKKFTTF